jgi:hypothetical protein
MSNSFISGSSAPAVIALDPEVDGTPEVLDTSIDVLDVSIE